VTAAAPPGPVRRVIVAPHYALVAKRTNQTPKAPDSGIGFAILQPAVRV